MVGVFDPPFIAKSGKKSWSTGMSLLSSAASGDVASTAKDNTCGERSVRQLYVGAEHGVVLFIMVIKSAVRFFMSFVDLPM